MPKAKIEWNKILKAIKERHAELTEFGVRKMTIRFIYYYLIQSRPELKLTDMGKPYGSLDEWITKWKKDSKLDREWFEDRSRPDVDWLPEETPEEYAEDKASDVLSSADDYDVYRWFKQPIYVEVWVEKDTMQPILKQILDGKQVRVAVCKGFISDAKLYEHTKRLAHYQLWKDKKIVVLYLGDLDPSGENMDERMPERLDGMNTGLSVWDKEKFQFKRIAVKMEHVNRYNLYKLTPDIKPGDDKQTIESKERLKRDPRASEFKANHNNELFGVELDAMAARGALEDLARIVRREVDNCFDKNIEKRYAGYLSKENVKKWLIQKYEDALYEVANEWNVSNEEPTPYPD
jgi:5S rRNA maturation endonuclease (ribonuclease M5)